MNELRDFPIYVVRILDTESLIINIGSKENENWYRQGMDDYAIKIGDQIKVIEPGPMIVDPITEVELGYLDRSKDILEIVDLYPETAICKKMKNRVKPPLAEAFVPIIETDDDLRIAEPLCVNTDEITPIKAAFSPISIGDPVQFV